MFVLRILALGALIVAQVAQAQDGVGTAAQDEPLPQQQPITRPIQTGRTPESAVGEVGQRLTREQASPNAKPMARISSRIQNRIQSRIRNRIDRNYDPQANATSPFATAEEQVRAAGRPNR